MGPPISFLLQILTGRPIPSRTRSSMSNPASFPPWARSQPEPVSTPVDPLLTDKGSAALLHVAVSTFRRYVAGGLVPPPIKLGGTSRWPQSEILGVIEAAKEARAVGANGNLKAK